MIWGSEKNKWRKRLFYINFAMHFNNTFFISHTSSAYNFITRHFYFLSIERQLKLFAKFSPHPSPNHSQMEKGKIEKNLVCKQADCLSIEAL